MGRPLKIKKSTTSDVGFPQFANVDPGTAVVPVGMTSTQFLGVVGGANAGIATATFPVVKITANVNGQQGAAYIITQKAKQNIWSRAKIRSMQGRLHLVSAIKFSVLATPTLQQLAPASIHKLAKCLRPQVLALDQELPVIADNAC